MANAITKFDDIIDSHGIIERIEELQSERDDLQTNLGSADDVGVCEDGSTFSEATDALKEFDESEEGQELKDLTALAEEAEDYASDWIYGETLIRESYWVEYVKELLVDCGDLPRDLPSYIEIDWEATAKNIAQDYTTVTFV